MEGMLKEIISKLESIEKGQQRFDQEVKEIKHVQQQLSQEVKEIRQEVKEIRNEQQQLEQEIKEIKHTQRQHTDMIVQLINSVGVLNGNVEELKEEVILSKEYATLAFEETLRLKPKVRKLEESSNKQ
ncbi:hypothetical protein P4S83_14785 [Aneurinibacillus thermoaerophilus]|uniref:hypothetical protein n=1 Tax=Aneurinibacillus thermoaerophilus TaxID=143495 RepID=UPI002E1CD4AF|nr:hypothetical protein [Aneurinibacillus thermoaerophilus]MED0765795.1 hypothetical protein [Aneurinibacillus thermoaerophilus]